MKFISWLKSLFDKKKDAPVLDLSAINKVALKEAEKVSGVTDIKLGKPFDPLNDIPSLKQIANDLCNAAFEYVGVREHGYNKGPEVELFQRFTDGKAQGESWCMAFVQFIVGKVCAKYGIKTPLYPSEHCNTVYQKTLTTYLSQVWEKGFAFIMRNPKDNSGHTGICDEAHMAIEGNTSIAGSTDGDGVYFRMRSPKGSILKPMRGYINLPLMIQDAIKAARAKAA